MPVNMGKEGESTYDGLTGNFEAKPSTVADKLVSGKDGRPDAIRVEFDVKARDDTVSLFVPLHESAADRLRPFIPNVPDDVPTTEEAMRDYLVKNLPASQTFLVYASRGSIRGVTAKPGKQRVQLTGLAQYTNTTTGKRRARFFTMTKDYETVTWTVPYEGVKTARVGDKPNQDDIDLNPNPYMFEYLIALGLDWEQLGQELAAAYEDEHLFSRLGLDGEVPGFFSNPEDLTDELYQAARRHNPNRWCEVTLVDHKQYGIGPKRGDYSHIDLTPIVIEGAAPATNDVEFGREVALFLDQWEVLTKVVLAKDDARFMAGGKFTADGVAMIKAILKPLVVAYPKAVLIWDAEGNPGISPETPTAKTWALDGLVCANFTAERLMKLAVEDNAALFELVNLSDHTGAKVVEWAAENVPEWASIGEEAGEVF